MAGGGFVLFIEEGVDRLTVVRAVGGEDVRVMTSWWAFATALDGVAAAAVITRELTRARADDIIRLRASRPTVPLVLVCVATSATLRRVNRLPELEGILILDQLEDGLRAALRSAADRSVLLQAAAWIETRSHLPGELRDALAKACRRRSPVRTVDQLATQVLGASPNVLRGLWKKAGIEAKPHAFVDWLLLAYGAAKPPAGATLQAKALGVKRDTVQNARKRLLGTQSSSTKETTTLMQTLRQVLADDETHDG